MERAIVSCSARDRPIASPTYPNVSWPTIAPTRQAVDAVETGPLHLSPSQYWFCTRTWTTGGREGAAAQSARACGCLFFSLRLMFRLLLMMTRLYAVERLETHAIMVFLLNMALSGRWGGDAATGLRGASCECARR